MGGSRCACCENRLQCERASHRYSLSPTSFVPTLLLSYELKSKPPASFLLISVFTRADYSLSTFVPSIFSKNEYRGYSIWKRRRMMRAKKTRPFRRLVNGDGCDATRRNSETRLTRSNCSPDRNPRPSAARFDNNYEFEIINLHESAYLPAPR